MIIFRVKPSFVWEMFGTGKDGYSYFYYDGSKYSVSGLLKRGWEIYRDYN